MHQYIVCFKIHFKIKKVSKRFEMSRHQIWHIIFSWSMFEMKKPFHLNEIVFCIKCYILSHFFITLTLPMSKTKYLSKYFSILFVKDFQTSTGRPFRGTCLQLLGNRLYVPWQEPSLPRRLLLVKRTLKIRYLISNSFLKKF